jgi:hypothetical protein
MSVHDPLGASSFDHGVKSKTAMLNKCTI